MRQPSSASFDERQFEPGTLQLARRLLTENDEVGHREAQMLFCALCKIWVQPIQWVAYMLNGQLDLYQACPCCQERLQQREPATV